MLSQCLLTRKVHTSQVSSSNPSQAAVLGVPEEHNTVMQLTYKILSRRIHAQFSVLVLRRSIKLRSRLAAKQLGSKGWGPTTTVPDYTKKKEKKKKELVTDSDLYKSSLFFLHKGKDCRYNHWFTKSSEESIILRLGMQTSR